MYIASVARIKCIVLIIAKAIIDDHSISSHSFIMGANL